MKDLPVVLIALAAVLVVVALFSRLSLQMVGGIESRAMVGLAAILLLFAIAIQGLKK